MFFKLIKPPVSYTCNSCNKVICEVPAGNNPPQNVVCECGVDNTLTVDSRKAADPPKLVAVWKSKTPDYWSFDANKVKPCDLFDIDWSSIIGVEKSGSSFYIEFNDYKAVVVHSSATLGSDIFAMALSRKLEISIPSSHLILRRHNPEPFICLQDHLEEFNEFHYLLVTEFLKYDTLSSAKPETLSEMLSPNKTKGRDVCQSLGSIMALDLMINNTTRLPLMASHSGNPRFIVFTDNEVIALNSILHPVLDPNNERQKQPIRNYLAYCSLLISTIMCYPSNYLPHFDHIVETFKKLCKVELSEKACIQMQEGIVKFVKKCSEISVSFLYELKRDLKSLDLDCGCIDFFAATLVLFQAKGRCSLEEVLISSIQKRDLPSAFHTDSIIRINQLLKREKKQEHAPLTENAKKIKKASILKDGQITEHKTEKKSVSIDPVLESPEISYDRRVSDPIRASILNSTNEDEEHLPSELKRLKTTSGSTAGRRRAYTTNTEHTQGSVGAVPSTDDDLKKLWENFQADSKMRWILFQLTGKTIALKSHGEGGLSEFLSACSIKNANYGAFKVDAADEKSNWTSNWTKIVGVTILGTEMMPMARGRAIPFKKVVQSLFEGIACMIIDDDPSHINSAMIVSKLGNVRNPSYYDFGDVREYI